MLAHLTDAMMPTSHSVSRRGAQTRRFWRSSSFTLLLCVAAFAAVGLRGQSPAVGPPSPAAAAELQPTPDARPLRIDTGAAGLWQMLQRLHTRASLLMITAHPDDEDGGMLAYESR